MQVRTHNNNQQRVAWIVSEPTFVYLEANVNAHQLTLLI